MKALMKAPEQRYTSAAEFAEALKPYESGRYEPKAGARFTAEPTVSDGPTLVQNKSVDQSKTIKMNAGAAPPGGFAQTPQNMPIPQPMPSSPGVSSQRAPGYERPRIPPTQIHPSPGAAPGGPTLPQAPTSGGRPAKGVNVITLVIVAVACLLIGVGLTTVVIFLTQR
jgi:serine/threonine-protein kinase